MRFEKKIAYFFLFVFFIRLGNLFAQDIHFSQFYESPVLLNPACAGGSNSDFRLVVNYKNQWKNVVSPFKTTAIAFDAKVYTNKRSSLNHIGYGFSFFNDKTGLSKLTTNQVNLTVAYHVYFNRANSLSAGINVGGFQKSINTTNLKWDAQFDGKNYDASLPTNENNVYQSVLKFDLGAGLVYKYNQPSSGINLEIGNSLTHLTQPKISFYGKGPRVNFKYLCHVILQTKISESTYFIPAFMYALQGPHTEFTGGGNIKFVLGEQTRDRSLLNTYTMIASSIQFGAFYRFKDALVFTMALDYKKSMSFGFSYDVTVSKLTKANNHLGGLELAFVLKNIGNSKKRGNMNDR